jgi:hypothetical protein
MTSSLVWVVACWDAELIACFYSSRLSPPSPPLSSFLLPTAFLSITKPPQSIPLSITPSLVALPFGVGTSSRPSTSTAGSTSRRSLCMPVMPSTTLRCDLLLRHNCGPRSPGPGPCSSRSPRKPTRTDVGLLLSLPSAFRGRHHANPRPQDDGAHLCERKDGRHRRQVRGRLAPGVAQVGLPRVLPTTDRLSD